MHSEDAQHQHGCLNTAVAEKIEQIKIAVAGKLTALQRHVRVMTARYCQIDAGVTPAPAVAEAERSNCKAMTAACDTTASGACC
jgi:hypothetical protein